MWLTEVALSYKIQDIKDKRIHRRGFEMNIYLVVKMIWSEAKEVWVASNQTAYVDQSVCDAVLSHESEACFHNSSVFYKKEILELVE